MGFSKGDTRSLDYGSNSMTSFFELLETCEWDYCKP